MPRLGTDSLVEEFLFSHQLQCASVDLSDLFRSNRLLSGTSNRDK